MLDITNIGDVKPTRDHVLIVKGKDSPFGVDMSAAREYTIHAAGPDCKTTWVEGTKVLCSHMPGFKVSCADCEDVYLVKEEEIIATVR
tara:strand:- start:74778 stop:75041 length:264 start_codon:yes stop_codon:yes gene_type:complete